MDCLFLPRVGSWPHEPIRREHRDHHASPHPGTAEGRGRRGDGRRARRQTAARVHRRPARHDRAWLRDRYARLVAGSSDPYEVWLNWIVRRRSDTQPIGTVQATLTTRDGQSTANVAWVIGVDWQNQGFASEAARALIEWVRQHGADDVIACIHPDHQASAVVAARAGLRPTDEQRDGEQVWRASDRRDRVASDREDGAPSKAGQQVLAVPLD
jgi:RimJ/RimL family protein N-acetyltransferase